MAVVRDTSPKAIADLYERWTLDVVLCLGQSCAVLCRDNPQQFKAVPASVLVALADLRYRTGHDSVFLAEQQRKEMLIPLLGDSDGVKSGDRSGPFHRAADAVRSRAKDFVQRVFTTGEEQLRDAFRDAVTALHGYLTTVQGTVVDDANARNAKHFDAVVGILRTPAFAAGLGLQPAPATPSTWPLDASWDGDGAFLVQAITQHPRAAWGKPPVTDSEFMQAQRIATYGAATIDALLKDPVLKTTAGVDRAIGLAYKWGTGIAELTGVSGSAKR